jgi:hypothetical protein
VTVARLAWSAWGLAVLLQAGTVALALSIPESSLPPSERDFDPAFVVVYLAFSTVGALVASRRPDNPLGWIMCVAGLSYAVGGVCVSYVESTLAGGDDDALRTVADWISEWVWMVGIGPAATFLLLLFPTGHLPSPRWRPVAWTAAGALSVMVAGLATGVDVAAGIGTFVLLPAAIASIASLVVRFRRAQRKERRALKWLT